MVTILNFVINVYIEVELGKWDLLTTLKVSILYFQAMLTHSHSRLIYYYLVNRHIRNLQSLYKGADDDGRSFDIMKVLRRIFP